MVRHRLLPAGEAGRGMAHVRADRGGGGSPVLHGASAQEGWGHRRDHQAGPRSCPDGQALAPGGRNRPRFWPNHWG